MSWDTASFKSLDQSSHKHSWPHTKIFHSTFNFREFVSTCKKSGYFITSFQRSIWLKNPVICLAKSILAHISGTKLFPSAGFVQECNKWIFIMHQIQKKLMAKFLNKFKKSHFRSIFPISGTKYYFKNSGTIMNIPIWPQSSPFDACTCHIHVTSLMRVKNSTCHFYICLLLSAILK